MAKNGGMICLILKNYTTNKDCNRTIAEIERTLAGIGAKKVLKEYDKQQNVSSLQFIININDRDVPIKLPARVDRVPSALRHIINNEKVTSSQRSLLRRAMSDPSRAANIGWRIIQDWLEAQVAVMQLDQINMMEALLPFTVWTKDGSTLYELLEQSNFDPIQLSKNLIEQKDPDKI
jgi:hypothetical protein